MTDRLQQQARALGDPTRHAIFRMIGDAGPDGTGVAELTARLECNHNAVRQHVAKLCAAGLVVESLAPSTGPGRRRLLYRVHPDAAGRWEGPNPYEELSTLLIDTIARGGDARAAGRAAGRRVAETSACGRAPAREPLDRFEECVASRGFEPTRVDRDRAGGGAAFVLRRCPFATAAAADPAVVCALHLGLLEGMAEECGGYEVERLVVKRPDRAGCRIELAAPRGHSPRATLPPANVDAANSAAGTGRPTR
jgi:predicted ArsR family transcriptional regulator